jgi:hypothetical protein
LSSGNQLQQLLRVIQPFLEFRAERLGGDLRGDGNFAGGGIGGNEFHFINANRRFLGVAQGLLDLLDQVLGLRSAHGKSAHQAREVVARDLRGEMNAGQARHGEQVSKAALGLPRLQRNAVEKKLVVGNPEQESTIAGLGQRLLELFPRGFELSLCALMADAVQTGVLDQNIETVDKGARSRVAVGIGLGGGGNGRPLGYSAAFL